MYNLVMSGVASVELKNVSILNKYTYLIPSFWHSIYLLLVLPIYEKSQVSILKNLDDFPIDHIIRLEIEVQFKFRYGCKRQEMTSRKLQSFFSILVSIFHTLPLKTETSLSSFQCHCTLQKKNIIYYLVLLFLFSKSESHL